MGDAYIKSIQFAKIIALIWGFSWVEHAKPEAQMSHPSENVTARHYNLERLI